jgi:phosphoadenosine phosphosulfate reductase
LRKENNIPIDELAIQLIQAFEPPEGYYLGFSGGKDSTVIYDLAKRAKVKVSAHYSVSPVDPPQIHTFIKEEYPEVIWDYLAKGFFSKLVPKKGLPLRKTRWCCQYIKESGGLGQHKILGMRKEESSKRSNYTCFSQHTLKGQTNTWLLPIVNWSVGDVWRYIGEKNLNVCSLYEEGYSRVGCVLCPFSGKAENRKALEKFPKLVQAWKRAGGRYLKLRREDPKRKPPTFQTEDEYFNWWITR